jgi:hypothetical protein
VATQLEMIFRTTAVFVADVAFANIACKYDNFLRRMENACLTMTHDTPYNSSRDVAALFTACERLQAMVCGIARDSPPHFPFRARLTICDDSIILELWNQRTQSLP